MGTVTVALGAVWVPWTVTCLHTCPQVLESELESWFCHLPAVDVGGEFSNHALASSFIAECQ